MSDINAQKERVEAEIKKLEAMGGSLSGRVKNIRDSAFQRFPLLFVSLSTFGLVATLYGFEKVIDQIEFFEKHPVMVLVVGIATLFITGSLYKKLD